MAHLSLIEELQRDALDRAVRVSDLLRKSKLVAAKLTLSDFAAWIESELNGWSTEVPEYRMLRGTPMALNPYRGWIPLRFQSAADHDSLAVQAVGQSIASLEDLVRDRNGQLCFPYPPALVQALDAQNRVPFGRYALHVDASQIVGILDAARNAVLDWAIKLEQAGIKGEGFVFTKEEKEMAHQPNVQVSIGSVENFAGMIGVATTGATVNVTQQIGLDLAKVRETVEQVEQVLPAAGLTAGAQEEARELVAGVRTEMSKPSPDEGKIRTLLAGLKKIAEGATIKLIADGMANALKALL